MSLWKMSTSDDGYPTFEPFDAEAASAFAANDTLRRPLPAPIEATGNQVAHWRAGIATYRALVAEMLAAPVRQAKVTWE